MATSLSSLPAAAASAATAALTDALAAAHIIDSPSSDNDNAKLYSKPDKAGVGAASSDGHSNSELEDGEIRESEEDGEGEGRDNVDGEGDRYGEEEEEDDGRVKTVFDDENRFNVKHPLFSQWTLYFDSPQSKALPKTPSSTSAQPGIAHGGWMADIRKVVAIDSVEEFWGLYNNIVPPSQLPGKANYYLFKDGIMPAWEDTQNKNGGKWAIQVPRDKSKTAIDRMWLYTMLAAIGETFETPATPNGEKAVLPDTSDLVTGVICSSRPGFYRIAIWTRQAPDTNLPETEPLMHRILTIGKHFKTSVLGYDAEQKLVTGGFQTEVIFESHKDSEKKGNKNKITV